MLGCGLRVLLRRLELRRGRRRGRCGGRVRRLDLLRHRRVRRCRPHRRGRGFRRALRRGRGDGLRLGLSREVPRSGLRDDLRRDLRLPLRCGLRDDLRRGPPCGWRGSDLRRGRPCVLRCGGRREFGRGLGRVLQSGERGLASGELRGGRCCLGRHLPRVRLRRAVGLRVCPIRQLRLDPLRIVRDGLPAIAEDVHARIQRGLVHARRGILGLRGVPCRFGKPRFVQTALRLGARLGGLQRQLIPVRGGRRSLEAIAECVAVLVHLRSSPRRVIDPEVLSASCVTGS
jgi:hypothetical protein